jgi:hypothetical protein
MKLVWFNTKKVGNDQVTTFGCAWPFFLIIAAIIVLIWWLV